MAKVIKKNEPFKKQQARGKLLVVVGALLCLLSSVGCAVYGAKAEQPRFFLFGVVGGAIGILTLTLFLLHRLRTADIRRAGKTGEDMTGRFLAQLPDSYTVIMNAVITYDGKQSEIDNIVVGPTGVFVIETKNHNGTITADYNAHDWLQVKVGRGGTTYRKTFYSPVKQVGTHVYRLAHYLRQHRVNTRIEAAVFFANPQARVRLVGEPDGIPVFTADTASRLYHFITDAPQKLSPAMVKHIVKLLD